VKVSSRRKTGSLLSAACSEIEPKFAWVGTGGFVLSPLGGSSSLSVEVGCPELSADSFPVVLEVGVSDAGVDWGDGLGLGEGDGLGPDESNGLGLGWGAGLALGWGAGLGLGKGAGLGLGKGDGLTLGKGDGLVLG